MSLETRLRDLLADDQRELAQSLAKGAVGSQSPQTVELTPRGIRVETQSFVGRHELYPTADIILSRANASDADLIALEEVQVGPGVYQFKGEDVSLEVTTRNTHTPEITNHLMQYCSISESTGGNDDDEFGFEFLSDTPDVEDETPSSSEEQSSSEDQSSDVEPVNQPVTDGGSPNSLFRRIRQRLPL